MKIALVTPGFSADENDWCIPILYHLVRELAKVHEIHVFTLRYPHRMDTYPFHGATVHALGGAARAGLARIPLLFRSLTAILSEARRKPFDLIHAFWADEPGFLSVLAGGMLKIPGVVSLMGGELIGLQELDYGGRLSLVNKAFTDYVMRWASSITAGSQYLRQIAQVHSRQTSIHLLPLGVDTKMFHPPESDAPTLFSQNTLHLLHAASLVPVKDQKTLIHAFALCQPPNSHLHILGDGPMRPPLERLVEELELTSCITFHGSRPHHETPRFYQSADLCVLSSRFESQGMVVLEAAACGITTVGTAVGILPEMAPPEQVVPVGNVEALASAISTAIQHPARLREIGRSHINQVQEHYSLEKCISRLENIYLSVR